MKSTVISIMKSCWFSISRSVEFNDIQKMTWKAHYMKDFSEKHNCSWKVKSVMKFRCFPAWKVQLFMKSAGAFHEKCNLSWKVHEKRRCLSWKIQLFMKSTAFHTKDHLQGIVTLCFVFFVIYGKALNVYSHLICISCKVLCDSHEKKVESCCTVCFIQCYCVIFIFSLSTVYIFFHYLTQFTFLWKVSFNVERLSNRGFSISMKKMKNKNPKLFWMFEKKSPFYQTTISKMFRKCGKLGTTAIRWVKYGKLLCQEQSISTIPRSRQKF